MMANQKREYKRREDFTDEEWKRKIIEAWRLKAEKGWGRIKIGRELGISPNTVGPWINTKKTKKVEEEYESGILQYRIKDAKRTIEEEVKKGITSKERAEELLTALYFCYYEFCLNYPRRKRIKEEGDDSYLIYC